MKATLLTSAAGSLFASGWFTPGLAGIVLCSMGGLTLGVAMFLACKSK